MFLVLLALLVVIPLAEVAAMVAVGQWIGVWEAIALLFTISIVGFFLVKRQGGGAWRRIRSEMRSGQVPAAAVLDGALVLLAGLLLLIPGFLTAIAGLALLVPPVRDLIRRFAGRKITKRVRYIDAVSSEMRPQPPRLTP